MLTCLQSKGLILNINLIIKTTTFVDNTYETTHHQTFDQLHRRKR